MDEATRKAAVLIAALDSESADALLGRMDLEQEQQVRNALMELEVVSDSEEESVLADFLGKDLPGPVADDGIELGGTLAQKLSAGGGDRDRIDESRDDEPWDPVQEAEPFRFLHEATIDSLADHLRSESPQVVAVVVAHLPPKRAADLLKRLTPALQGDVLRRVAELDRTDRETIAGLEQSLQLALADEIRTAKNRSSGVAAVASILAAAGSDCPQLLGNLAKSDEGLARSITFGGLTQPAQPIDRPAARTAADRSAANSPKRMSDSAKLPSGTERAPDPRQSVAAAPSLPLWELPAHELARLLPLVDPDLLLLALAGAPVSFVEKALRPLSAQKRREFRQRMAQIGPMRLSDVEEAQRRVADMAGRLRENSRPSGEAGKRFAAAA